jgi:hypothetical protein
MEKSLKMCLLIPTGQGPVGSYAHQPTWKGDV